MGLDPQCEVSIQFDTRSHFVESDGTTHSSRSRTEGAIPRRMSHCGDDQMIDQAPTTRTIGSGVPDDEIRHLAEQAIALLATDGGARSGAVSQKLRSFASTFISTDEDERHDALLKLRQDGVAPGDIIDHVVPAAARLLGDQWLADDISFVDVTIGAARLQETVHALSSRMMDQSGDEGDHGSRVMLIVPRAEQHTLGPCVLADQFRRMGYQPTILVDLNLAKITAELRRRRYAMVGISISCRRTLASVKDLVDIVKSNVTTVTPVVLGGSFLDKTANILGVTGAHHTATDARGALLACGLPEHAPAARQWVTA